MKLWNKGVNLNKAIEKYTVGNDPVIDKALIKYDCIASIAHAKMLHKIKVLTKKETDGIVKILNSIISDKKFTIKPEDEDCHTAIENRLVEKLGDAGKKIHTARSRNDQVLVAMRLYSKDHIKTTIKLAESFINTCKVVMKKHGSVILPGYTHMQKAMPSSIGMWLGSFVDSMQDNISQLTHIYNIVDQNPLGSGAGYGIPVFKIDRKLTTKLLGFGKIQKNPIYCQTSRGKFEANIVHALSNIMLDMNKLASDLILFSMQEFGYFTLPKEFCTGSSIMPQKKNPDVLELVRAKYNLVLAEEFKLKNLSSNLISGYNRDMQLTKEPLMKSFEIIESTLNIVSLIISKLKINAETCKKACSKEIYATGDAYKLVKKGIPFREAYKTVGKKYH